MKPRAAPQPRPALSKREKSQRATLDEAELPFPQRQKEEIQQLLHLSSFVKVSY